MNERDGWRQVWIVVGPLDPDSLPPGCKAEKPAPALVRQVSELLRLMEKPAQLRGA